MRSSDEAAEEESEGEADVEVAADGRGGVEGGDLATVEEAASSQSSPHPSSPSQPVADTALPDTALPDTALPDTALPFAILTASPLPATAAEGEPPTAAPTASAAAAAAAAACAAARAAASSSARAMPSMSSSTSTSRSGSRRTWSGGGVAPIPCEQLHALEQTELGLDRGRRLWQHAQALCHALERRVERRRGPVEVLARRVEHERLRRREAELLGVRAQVVVREPKLAREEQRLQPFNVGELGR
jgi:exonuclease VII small subunit